MQTLLMFEAGPRGKSRGEQAVPRVIFPLPVSGRDRAWRLFSKERKMIRHLVLFRFRSDADNGSRRAVLDGLAQLPTLFPTMRRFGLGENVSLRDRTFTHAMTIEFDSRDQLENYLASSVHERFVSDTFRPAVENRVIASYEWSELDGDRGAQARPR